MVSKTVSVNFSSLNPLLVKVGLGNMVVATGVVILSVMVASAFFAVSVFIGEAIGIINLSLLVKTIKGGFLLEPDKAQRFVKKRYYSRLLATLLIVGILISKGFADPVGFIVGLSVIMATTLVILIYFTKKELV